MGVSETKIRELMLLYFHKDWSQWSDVNERAIRRGDGLNAHWSTAPGTRQELIDVNIHELNETMSYSDGWMEEHREAPR